MNFSIRLSPITTTLIGLNALVFGIEIFQGGSIDGEILFRMGGVWPEAIEAGQWWRLFTANFLHAGWPHLLLNMFGFWCLGPFVERSLGPWLYLLIYFISGIGAMLIVTILAISGTVDGQLLVGASGSIMGLVGATAAISLFAWRYDRSYPAFRRLREIALLILIQILFDIFTPKVSFTAHAGGLIIGFWLTALLELTKKT